MDNTDSVYYASLSESDHNTLLGLLNLRASYMTREADICREHRNLAGAASCRKAADHCQDLLNRLVTLRPVKESPMNPKLPTTAPKTVGSLHLMFGSEEQRQKDYTDLDALTKDAAELLAAAPVLSRVFGCRVTVQARVN